MNKTILFCTDNRCPEPLFSAVVNHLREFDLPIVSVSHEPLDLGTNICIGKRKSSWLCLYQQLLIGLEVADTDYITIAEHDCFYTQEHFDWMPPTDDIFYYNENVWLTQWSDTKHLELKGMFSTFPKKRLALSQLVCNRRIYLDTISKRLDIIDQDRRIIKGIDHIGEPGVSRVKRVQRWAASGRCAYLKQDLGKVLELEKYETFKTKLPNLDVRHDTNFTGPRRGRNRRYELHPWGKFEDVLRRYA